MPVGINQLEDRYVITTELDDQLSAGADVAETHLRKLDSAAAQAQASLSASAQASTSAGASYATMPGRIAPVVAGHDALNLTANQTRFVYRMLATDVVGGITALASGAPVMSVVTMEASRLATQLTLTGRGFRIFQEGWAVVTGAIGAWPVVAVGAAVAGIAALGVYAESTARQQAALATSLAGTRDDYKQMADVVEQAARKAGSAMAESSKDILNAARQIGAAPQFQGTADDLAALVEQAGAVARVMRTDLPTAAALYAKAIRDPAEAIKELGRNQDVLKIVGADVLALAQSYVRAGDNARASQVLIDALAKAAKIAPEQLTPLDRAIIHLSETMNTTMSDGRTFALTIGDAFRGMAVKAIEALDSIVQHLQSLIDKIRQAPQLLGLLGLGSVVVETAPQSIVDWFKTMPSLGSLYRNFFGGAGPGAAGGVSAPTGGVNAPAGAVQQQIIDRAYQLGLNDAQRAFALAVANRESRFQQYDPKTGGVLTSSAGAQGIFQLMPDTAKTYGVDALNPSENISGGLSNIKKMWEHYNGDPVLVAMALNWGPTKTDAFVDALITLRTAQPGTSEYQRAMQTVTRVPAETQNYISAITGQGVGSYQPSAYQTGVRLASGGMIGTDTGQNARGAVTSGMGSTTAEIEKLQTALRDAEAAFKSLSQTQGENAQLTREQGARVANLREQLANALNPLRQETQALNNQAEVQRQEGAAAQQLMAIQQQQAKWRTENSDRLVTEAQRQARATDEAKEYAAAQNRLKAGYDAKMASLDRDIAAMQTEGNAMGQSAKAARDAATHQAAYNETLNSIPKNAPGFNQAVDAMAGKMRQLQDATDFKGLQQYNQSLKDQQTYLEAEIKTLGMDANARQIVLDQLKAEQDLRRQYVGISDESIQASKNQIATNDQLSQSLRSQTEAMSYVENSFTTSFNAISDGITQSLLQGTGAAVNWGNIMASIAQRVLSEFLKLAVLNPLLNSLFGGSSGQHLTTLGDVFGALGGIGGGSGTTSTGLGGLGGLSNITSLFKLGGGGGGWGDIFGFGSSASPYVSSGGGGLFGNLFGSGGLGNLFSSTGPIADFLQTPLWGASSATKLMGLTGYTPLTNAGLATAGATTIGSLLGGVGLGTMAGSLLGSFMPHPQNAQIGSMAGSLAGFGIGSIFGGPLIGGLIGGLLGSAGGLFGPPPKNPWSSTRVDMTGEGFLSVGGTMAQLVDASQERSDTLAAAAAINDFLKQSGVRMSSIGRLWQVGQNTPGGFQDPTKFASVADAFAGFRWTAPTDTGLSQLLSDRSFASLDELKTIATAFRQFATDITAAGAANYIPQFLNQVTGLANANIAAKLQEIDTFVTQTVPTLEAFGKVTGSLNDEIKSITDQFNAAIQTAQQLGYHEAELTAARDKAINKARQEVYDANNQQTAGFQGRAWQANANITGDLKDALTAALFTFDINAEAERKGLREQYYATFGEDYSKWTPDQNAQWQQAWNTLNAALNLERQYVTQQNQQAVDQQRQSREQTGASIVTSIADYVHGLQMSSASPLSPQAQLDLARSQWQSVSGAALAGNADSLSQMTTYADSLLSAARNVYGSGTGYVDIFNDVLDKLNKVSEIPKDTLTASIYQSEVRQQTEALETAIDKLKDEISALRAQVAAGQVMPPRLAA